MLKTILSYGVSLFVVAVLVVMLAAFASYPVNDDQSKPFEYAVMYKLGTSQNEVVKNIVKAGGKPLRSGSFDFIAIAVSDDPDFKQTMYEQGAFVIFSPMIKGGCYTKNEAVFKS